VFNSCFVVYLGESKLQREVCNSRFRWIHS
jgi:hypothetical protein